MTVSVVEKPTGNLQLGAGFSSADNISLTFGVKQENVFGSGNYLGVEVNTSKLNRQFVLSTVDPYFTADGISRSIDLYYRTSRPLTGQGGDYQLKTRGASIRFGVPFTETDTVYFGGGYESLTIVPGSLLPISQVANVTLLDARTISVQPWEKGMGAKIEKAIRESDLGLNPAAQGDLLRVPMPALTEERRRELTKVARNEGEEAKIAVRNVRRDANEHARKLMKDKEVTEDEERRSLDEVQKLTDRTIAEVDRLIAAKEAEIMAV